MQSKKPTNHPSFEECISPKLQSHNDKMFHHEPSAPPYHISFYIKEFYKKYTLANIQGDEK